MFISQFLTTQERNYAKRQRQLKLARAGYALLYTALTLLLGLSFCVFAWTASNMEPPITSGDYPLPSWTWTAALWAVAITSMLSTVYTLFRALDEITYPAHSRSRITGRR